MDGGCGGNSATRINNNKNTTIEQFLAPYAETVHHPFANQTKYVCFNSSVHTSRIPTTSKLFTSLHFASVVRTTDTYVYSTHQIRPHAPYHHSRPIPRYCQPYYPSRYGTNATYTSGSRIRWPRRSQQWRDVKIRDNPCDLAFRSDSSAFQGGILDRNWTEKGSTEIGGLEGRAGIK